MEIKGTDADAGVLSYCLDMLDQLAVMLEGTANEAHLAAALRYLAETRRQQTFVPLRAVQAT